LRSANSPASPIVAVIAVRMMQPSTHEVIDVVTMRHGFVPAGRACFSAAPHLLSLQHDREFSASIRFASLP
jgi:hypothetical protein